MADGAKVTIDRAGCISCGLCWAECPEFFAENPNDTLSQVVEAYQVSGNPALGLAPPALLDRVRQAAEACPVSVIAIES